MSEKWFLHPKPDSHLSTQIGYIFRGTIGEIPTRRYRNTKKQRVPGGIGKSFKEDTKVKSFEIDYKT